MKETDRLAALANELTKLGAEVEIEDDDLTIIDPPRASSTPAAIDTYDDHRMAMSFALAGTKSRGRDHQGRRVREQDVPARSSKIYAD